MQEPSVAFFAISTTAISNIERHNDSTSFLQKSDTAAKLFNNPHILMACRQSEIFSLVGKWRQNLRHLHVLLAREDIITERYSRLCASYYKIVSFQIVRMNARFYHV